MPEVDAYFTPRKNKMRRTTTKGGTEEQNVNGRERRMTRNTLL
jgi:hypothetical protein